MELLQKQMFFPSFLMDVKSFVLKEKTNTIWSYFIGKEQSKLLQIIQKPKRFLLHSSGNAIVIRSSIVQRRNEDTKVVT